MTFRQWLRHLWSPVNVARIEDFPPEESEAPPALVKASLWRVDRWGGRHYRGHPELVSTAARRGALRHHVEVTTHGPAKVCQDGMTAAGYRFREYIRE